MDRSKLHALVSAAGGTWLEVPPLKWKCLFPGYFLWKTRKFPIFATVLLQGTCRTLPFSLFFEIDLEGIVRFEVF